MSRDPVTKRSILFFLACFSLPLLQVPVIWAGPYLLSAHGSLTSGVARSVISGLGYSRGNCTHCHEQHASIENSEPAPDNIGPSPYQIFAQNFSTTDDAGSYSWSNNFCFYCHSNAGSVQQVENHDYSETFGCATPDIGPNSIVSAMNQTSTHNLYDIYQFAMGEFPSWFTSYSNPCAACHNPHLARQNKNNPQDPAFTAISKPTAHFFLKGTDPLEDGLWGTSSDETMESYSNKYQPPYCDKGNGTFEPDANGNATTSDTKTPDYVSFCITCHSQSITRASNGQTINAIDWSITGDKHGLRPMDGSVSTKDPYSEGSDTPTDFVLSCLDCHEPHGSENVMLIRRQINGFSLGGIITEYATTDWGLVCGKCHNSNWKWVHHDEDDAPYFQEPGQCDNCHPDVPGLIPIPCQECHAHGGAVTEPDTQGPGIGNKRIGF